MKSCVNPHHLFLGTHVDNMRDMSHKGRNKFKGFRKLLPAQVTEIRNNRAISGRKFAKLLGVTEAHISLIRNNRVWRERA